MPDNTMSKYYVETYLLQTGGRPFISPKPTKKLTIPVYAGSLVDIQNAELEIQEAYEKGVS